MKKALIVLLGVTLFPVLAFSGDLPADIKLSNNVSASYFVNADPATEYSVSTGHIQGNRVYFSGSNDQLIYYNDIADGSTFASNDLLQTHKSSFASDEDSYDGNL